MATATQHYDALDLFQHMVNNVFQSQAYDTPGAAAPQQRTVAKPVTERQETRMVRMDVSETEQAYLVLAEFPGIRKEEVSVTIEGKQILLQAEARPAPDVEGVAKRSLLSERFYGKMSRRIQLPQDIDEAAASAKFADGVLELRLPKKKAISGRKLEIQSA
jgi:HSP20 family protein